MAQMLWDPTQDPQRLSADFLRFYCERFLTMATDSVLLAEAIIEF